jgi:hypothetical protein
MVSKLQNRITNRTRVPFDKLRINCNNSSIAAVASATTTFLFGFGNGISSLQLY